MTTNPTIDGRDARTVLTALTEPIPHAHLEHRQDGKAIAKDGGWIARFVTYIEAGYIRQRLDEVVPLRWELSFSEPRPRADDDTTVFAIKATLAITLDDGTRLVREDFGEGTSQKGAATDAFKRAAVRWGIGGELYALPRIYVKVDSDSRYAKPLEDPADTLAKAIRAREQRLRRAASKATAPASSASSASSAPSESVARGAPGEPTAGSSLLAVYQRMSTEQRHAVMTLRALMDGAAFTAHQRAQVDEWLLTSPSATDLRARAVRATEYVEQSRSAKAS